MLGAKAALRPTLHAIVSMTNNATAGKVNTLPVPLTGVDEWPLYVNGVAQTYTRTPESVDQFFLGGYGTVLSQLFGRKSPDYSAGLQLTVPLRNRSAQADLSTDQLNYRQSEIQDRQQTNNIKLNVLNAETPLTQARAAYAASVRARELQGGTYAAQKRKFAPGSLGMMTVLIGQRDAIARELPEINALSRYVHSRTTLRQLTGTILKDQGVVLEGAQSGEVREQ
jgi:outer membrane protein